MEINELLKQARRLAKKVKTEEIKKDIKIAVLGSTSIQYFVMVLRLLLDKEGIGADIYEGEYNGIMMDVMDSDSRLYCFEPEIVILLPDYRDLKFFPNILDEEETVEQLVQSVENLYIKYWEKISEIQGCQILQSNYILPPERIYGNIERRECFSITKYLELVNQRLSEAAPQNVCIVDLDFLAQNIGRWNWFDDTSYYLTKAGFRIDYIEEIVASFVRQILALKGKLRKCLVLDLDNTLWGGIVGDDGCYGIQLDPNSAIGESYREFQTYVLRLKQRGVILAVVSKNELTNAKEPFEKNPHMVLSLDDIASFQANWDDKVSNIKKVALELNIGIDSLVFFDDNPAEREIVKTYLPEVMVVDVPKDPSLYKRELDKASPFDWLQITGEDVLRNNSYISNRKRNELEMQFVDYDEYLKNLEMKGEVYLLEKKDLNRFTQLLNKSNQFNLRTIRYAQSDVEEFYLSDYRRCICVSLTDKFSEYGIISCVILHKIEELCFIEAWVMSCRVIKRGVEDMVFKSIIKIAKEWGCNAIQGEYIPTEKNVMVKDLYDKLGFTLNEEQNGIKRYTYYVTTPYTKELFISQKEDLL